MDAFHVCIVVFIAYQFKFQGFFFSVQDVLAVQYSRCFGLFPEKSNRVFLVCNAEHLHCILLFLYKFFCFVYAVKTRCYLTDCRQFINTFNWSNHLSEVSFVIIFSACYSSLFTYSIFFFWGGGRRVVEGLLFYFLFFCRLLVLGLLVAFQFVFQFWSLLLFVLFFLLFSLNTFLYSVFVSFKSLIYSCIVLSLLSIESQKFDNFFRGQEVILQYFFPNFYLFFLFMLRI